MDVFLKGLNQLAERYRSLSPNARIASAVLAVAVVLSLGWLFRSQVASGEIHLLGGQSFSTSELQAMEAAFGKSNLSGYQIEGGRIRIPRGQQAAYMGALADAGALPANFNSYLDAALDDDSPWSSPKQREERLKIAKQQELALIIRSMQGIEKAAVHYDAKKTSTFGQEVTFTASVSVKPSGGAPLDPKQVPMIRELVAGAIAGLAPESVTVIDLNGRAYPGGMASELPSLNNDPYIERMKEYQTTYESRILGALSYVRGITVTVNVVLNKELRHVENQNLVDRRGSEEAASAKLSTETSPVPFSSDEIVRGSKQTQVTLAALTPQRVTAAVGVPSSYFADVWRQRHPTVAGRLPRDPEPAELELLEREETEKIRAHVTSILPPPAPPLAAGTPLVTVTTFQSFAPETLPEPTTGEQVLAWLGKSWSTLGMFGLAIVGLALLRSVAKSAPTPSSSQPPHMPDDLTASPADRPQPTTLRRIDGASSPLDELAGTVRENPRAAATILRDWIGNAS